MDSEGMLLKISEFVCVEMDGIKSVEHDVEKTLFTVVTDCDNKFIVEVRQEG